MYGPYFIGYGSRFREKKLLPLWFLGRICTLFRVCGSTMDPWIQGFFWVQNTDLCGYTFRFGVSDKRWEPFCPKIRQ